MKQTFFANIGKKNTTIDIHSDQWWTGKPPHFKTCSGVNKKGIITSLPLIRTDSSRQEILDYFDNGWTLTEVLFSSLKSPEYIYACAYHKLRHPLIFYYIHPVAFYINKLRVAGIIDEPVDKEFETLFETGVDEMRWDNLYEGQDDIWPSLDDAHAYRKKVYNSIKNIIETHPALHEGHKPIMQGHPLWALFMAFEHDRIHLETSSVLIREIDAEYLQRPACWPEYLTKTVPDTPSEITNPLVKLDTAPITLGKPRSIPSFGWDNEYGKDTRNTSDFFASKNLISNLEFLEFVKDGGYRNPQFWSQEGWEWRSFRNTKWPTFWVQNGPAGSHKYQLRTIFEVIDMQWSWPVIVNFHEATAFCQWKTLKEQSQTPYRLLTEAEQHAIRDINHLSISNDNVLSHNGEACREDGVNHNLAYGAETPVNAFAANSKGFNDSIDNVWQWCEDHFHPLPHSTPHPYYDDFSAPCYDGKHQMILGGSFISTGDEASIWARFHFRPHFFQHAGFRIARTASAEDTSNAVHVITNKYEQQDTINQYLLMHYGSKEEIFHPVFPEIQYPDTVHLPSACVELARKHSKHFLHALDLGCAVGGASFALSQHFSKVTAIDYSESFITIANHLKEEGSFPYKRQEIGDIYTDMEAKISKECQRKNVHFLQGNACHLPKTLHDFDAVIFSNVLCRVPDPEQCLNDIPRLIKSGGILVLTAPYSWYETFSPKEKWITGDGDPLSALKKLLPAFSLLEEVQLPFVIREHARKYEYIITHGTVWKKQT